MKQNLQSVHKSAFLTKFICKVDHVMIFQKNCYDIERKMLIDNAFVIFCIYQFDLC